MKPFGGGHRFNPKPIRFVHERQGTEFEIISPFSGGMCTQFDPNLIPDNKVTKAVGVRNRVGKFVRTYGTATLTPTKPNSSKVLEQVYFKKNDGTEYVIRFDKLKLYKRGGSWTEITGAGLAGGDYDRFNVVSAFDSLVFSNNGVDKIQVCNAAVTTYAQLGNAPKYKYITAFANRIVGAYYNEATPNPVQVGWSGDGNITEWDGTVDITAGSGPLIESPGDVSDFITGIFGLTNYLVVLRERSVWVGTKQPSASDPFNFFVDVPGIGCNCPFASVIVPGGLIFIDTRTKGIYFYTPGQAPVPIQEDIEKVFFDAITNPERLFASYNKVEKEYTVAIPTSLSTSVRLWTYNFNTKAWVYEERSDVSDIGDLDSIGASLSIDDLQGTVDSLVGTVNDLGSTSAKYPTRTYGFGSGEITYEDATLYTDSFGTIPINPEIISKSFILPLDVVSITQLQIEYKTSSSFYLFLDYSVDDGVSWNQMKYMSIAASTSPRGLVTFKRNIRTRKFMFRLRVDSGGEVEFLKYRILGTRIATSYQETFPV